jgi:hypothetical protein
VQTFDLVKQDIRWRAPTLEGLVSNFFNIQIGRGPRLLRSTSATTSSQDIIINPSP